ncbi:MAG: glycosyltransferase family 4 protein, partial [Deltaproteobacteria bacterium]|nr:glycosyltransferase family 4 protein [Deltaproteobacteria bacterium]
MRTPGKASGTVASDTSQRILLLTDAYPPEIRSCPTLMRELALGLAQRGHNVSVLTTYPTYNLTPADREAFRDIRSNIVRDEEGIRVVRVPVPPLHNVGPIIKGVSELALPILISTAGALLGPVDVIITFSPPLTLGIAAAALKKRFGCKVVLNVQDIMPQAAIDLGVLANRALIRSFEAMEDLCYRHADRITLHSEGNVQWMSRHRPRYADRFELVHNWVDAGSYLRADPDPAVRRELGLDGKFVFMFGGVMGFAQDLDTVVEAARRLDGRQDVAFLLVGDGVARKGLETRAFGLSNVVFHPFVEPDRYIAWLKTFDAGLVTLKAEARTPVVPSKMLGFMAAGIPYLA